MTYDVTVPMYDSISRCDRDVHVRVRLSFSGTVDDAVVRAALYEGIRSALGFAASKYGILPSELSGREGPLAKDSRDLVERRLGEAGARLEAYDVVEARS